MNAVSQPTPEHAAIAQESAMEGSSIFQELLAKVGRIEARQAAPNVQPMELRNFDELERWAIRVQHSDLMPYGYKGKVDNIILAVQMGAELGLRPLQSLQNIAVINGKPTVFGDAMLALCMTHPLYVSTEEMMVGTGDARYARCITIRRGTPPVVRDFSVQDAKTARLWGKTGRDGQTTPWVTNPDRMLQFRARGFALRDAFPDKLRGIISAEEAADYDMDPGTSGAPSAAPAQQRADAAPPKAAAIERDPKMVRWVDDTCKAFGAVKTLKARSDITDKIAKDLDILREDAPEQAQRITAAIAAAGERIQAANPDANRAAYSAEPKPTPPPVEAGPFEHFLIDEFGEPVHDAAGELVMLATGLQFASAFASEAAKAGSIEALRENNADAIGDAGADKAAGQIIQAAIDGAAQRIAKRAQKPADAPAAAQDAAEAPAPLAIPLTPGHKPSWPKYLDLAKAAVLAMTTEPALAAWRELNRPVYTGSPVEAAIERALRERASAVNPAEPDAAADPDAEWARDFGAWIKNPETTYQEILDWAMSKTTQDKMSTLKREKNALFVAIKAAIDARTPRTEPGAV